MSAKEKLEELKRQDRESERSMKTAEATLQAEQAQLERERLQVYEARRQSGVRAAKIEQIRLFGQLRRAGVIDIFIH